MKQKHNSLLINICVVAVTGIIIVGSLMANPGELLERQLMANLVGGVYCAIFIQDPGCSGTPQPCTSTQNGLSMTDYGHKKCAWGDWPGYTYCSENAHARVECRYTTILSPACNTSVTSEKIGNGLSGNGNCP